VENVPSALRMRMRVVEKVNWPPMELEDPDEW